MIPRTRSSRRAFGWFGVRMTLITAVLIALATPSVTPTLSTQRFGSCAAVVDLAGRALKGSCGPSLTFTTPLPEGEVGVSYTTTLTQVGGSTPVTWSVLSGSLPTGITLDASTGVLSGTPTTSGTASFTIKITDSINRTATKAATLTIIAAPSFTFSAPSSGVVGTAYSTTFTSTGGSGSNVWSVSAGSPPAGLTLNPSTGVLSGTPTTAGTADFTVRVTDIKGGFDTRAVSLVIVSVSLTASSPSVNLGTPVTLTATVTPSDATGTVTFTGFAETGPAIGQIFTLGEGTVSGGVATLSATLPFFGPITVSAGYGGDGTHAAETSAPVSIESAAYVGEIIVNEFRSSGPNGGDDSYIELYNTGAPAALGGFVVAGADTEVTLPDGAVIQANRSYLLAGERFTGSVAADFGATAGPGGIQVKASDSAATQTDAVGPDDGYHRGEPLPAFTGTPEDEHAWVRLKAAGQPVDTGSNADDFQLVSTTGGLVGGVQSTLGSPAPTNSVSPYQHNSTLRSTLLDPAVGQTVTPNRAYTPGTGGSPGTLVIRRTITNTTGEPVTTMRIRITALSEANGAPKPGVITQPTNVAHLRVVDPGTATSSIPVSAGDSVTVQNLSVDAPATSDPGGGLNSTLTVPLPGGYLFDSGTVDVAITLAVDSPGAFWLGYDVDSNFEPG